MSTIRLRYDAFGSLVLTLPTGESVSGVVPVHCFPFSAPNECISLCDESGREVYCLPSLAELPDEVRTTLERELAAREFIPLIVRIESVSSGAEPTIWDVATDRGEIRFELPSEDNIRRLGDYGAIIADTHGVRYRVLDLRKLDAQSRKFLSRYL
jgi:hypothetical protein